MNDEMFLFGDSEPEDAWVPDDPTVILLANLDARCSLLGERRQLRDNATEREQVAELAERLARLYRRRRDFNDLQLVKLSLIDEDLAFIRIRLEAADG